jgi:hypothetical protein
MSTEDDLARELDMLLAKARANVPSDLKAGLLDGYRDMKRMAAMVRQPPGTWTTSPAARSAGRHSIAASSG